MRGIEDLGDGTNVTFQLEAGFSSTNGTFACGVFCRESVVGVTNLAAHAGVQETDIMM